MKYCIWNNKGGVGKSFLTFCLSTEYAIQHPDELVVVADMCPQANVSEILLGGNGVGEENQSKLYELGYTVANYIKDRYLRSRYEKLGTELQYFVKACDYNYNVPNNLYLLSGDVNLDLASGFVTDIYEDRLKEAPQRAMSMLKDILSVFEDAHKTKKVTMFIDCNPSFAIYTELAIFASNRLIIPCTGDHASLRGVENVMKILYGIGETDEFSSMFNIVNFIKKSADIKLMIPTIHSGIINKSRSYDSKATKAYIAHVKEIEKCFASLENPVPVTNIKDCNNISLVVNYTGIPISKLEQKQYDIYGVDSPVNESQLKPMRDDLNRLISQLEW